MINRYKLQKDYEFDIQFISNQLSFSEEDYKKLAEILTDKGFLIIPYNSFIVNSILDCLNSGMISINAICTDIEQDWQRMQSHK